MVAEYFSAGMKIGGVILKFLPNFIRKLWNYKSRPNLKFSLTHSHIEFSDNKGQILLPSFPSIRIQNTDSNHITFDLGKFYINGESLTYIIQQNTYFLRTQDQNRPENKLTTKNNIFNTFRENWTSAKLLKLPAHEYLDIPLFPQKMGCSTYFKILPDAKVFFPSRKIVISVTANSKEAYFAINRIDFLKIIINCLAHECRD